MFADERKAIESRFNSLWAGQTPVKYENVEFTEPKNAPWVALTIVNADGHPLSLQEGGTHRQNGIIFIQVFAPKDTGTQNAKTLADTAAGIFRSKKFSSGNSGVIFCKSASLMNIGTREGWYQINVKIPFFRLIQYPVLA